MECNHPAYRKEIKEGKEVLTCTHCENEFGEEEIDEFKKILENGKEISRTRDTKRTS